MPKPWQIVCADCERLARELEEAWQADERETRTRFNETARSAGRKPESFVWPWILSLAQMPDDEFEALQAARYPRVRNVRRRWTEHETRSGHAGLRPGWRAAFVFHTVICGGYAGFLKGHE
jgi:hypothetical protein